jgi:dihydroorotase
MITTLIKNAIIVNEGKQMQLDLLIAGDRIARIDKDITAAGAHIIDAAGMFLIPGAIDDQVHFREPGLTHKGEIYTEAKAAVAGGITSYMEMPNTIPNVFTQELLADKYQRAAQVSLANYSFFMGASNTNLEEVLKTNPENVCGVKIFMGSSTGNMLVDDEQVLSDLFRSCTALIATHCEDEQTVKHNLALYKAKYDTKITPEMHPLIRSEKACYLSSSKAVLLAKKYQTRLHILHISTAIETTLFDNNLPLKDKLITSEACIHHLWFSEADYATKGNWIKWNPAIKTAKDRDAILAAVLSDHIDVIATDHAPHTIEEKSTDYLNAPSGGPLVQHSIIAMLELVKQGKITIEKVVEKMAHNPAILFNIKERGYIREGYFADLVLVNPNLPQTVTKTNLLYKCGWSPFEGYTFSNSINSTFVNGHLAYHHGQFDESQKGSRLLFNKR